MTTENKRVFMYGTAWCGYCAAARSLLQNKQVEFDEVDLMEFPERRGEMQERSGRRSVPQIFIDDHHVGGFDDLNALERDGKLDELLAAN